MSSNAAFSIAPHVRVCVTGDGSVLLDLKRDKYLGLSKRDTELLAAAIGSWPKPRWDHTENASTLDKAAAEELCRSLAGDGLLILGASDAAQVIRDPLVEMKREWISVGDELEVDIQVTKMHALHFVASFTWARFSLAWQPFAATVEAIRVKKARFGSGVQADPSRIREIATLVCVFRKLRPLMFAAEGRCLLHALTLVRFLSRYGFYPEWVIGVATHPWAAHAWVQSGNFLLDTNPEKVCRYSPILVV